MINILINGCNGNMGKVVKQYIDKTPDISVKYEIDINTTMSFESLNKISDKPDVIIDFSTPKGSFMALDYAVCHLVPIVIATTSFDDEQKEKILEYSEAIPIFKASNMSYVIHLMSKISGNISPLLNNMDVEIIEKHHNKKKDAPSGTALLLANSINIANKNKYNYIYDRHSEKNCRAKNEIGFSSIRGGNVVGEHSVIFLGENESIEIKHTAYSREIFAEGAVRAAKFLVNQKNGLYGMDDLFN